MLTIETPYGLVNWANWQEMRVDEDHTGYVLSVRNGMTCEAYLCFGSESHCKDTLGVITDALRSGANVVTVRNGDPKPEALTGLDRAAEAAKGSGSFEDLGAETEKGQRPEYF